MEGVVRRERERVSRLHELVRKVRAPECGVLDFVLQKLPQSIAILERAVEVRIVAVVEDFLAVEQPGNTQRISCIEGVVDARVERGVVGASVALHLLDDDRAVVIRARRKLILVQRWRIEPIGLYERVRRAITIVDCERRIELGRALELRANGGQVLLLHPQRACTTHQAELSVEALPLLAFEYEVDDTGTGVRVEFGRWVVDDLDPLQRRRWKIVQAVLRAETGKRGLLAVDQHHHFVAAAH